MSGAMAGYEPKNNNFYEPRMPGRVFRDGLIIFSMPGLKQTAPKNIGLYSELMYVKRDLFGSERWNFNLNNRYRFNNKFTVSHRLNFGRRIIMSVLLPSAAMM